MIIQLAKSDYSTVVGAISKALEYGSISLGHSVLYAFAQEAISMGFYSKANGVGSIALGSYSKVTVDGGLLRTTLCPVGLMAFLGIRLF
ncbi:MULTISPECIES: hypothetical protein [unclassified Bartonella]|uniref:hypothetical protein n=1 Tax=unclassified Bartonella TaxID=2645622 RepID=UPI0035D09E14